MIRFFLLTLRRYFDETIIILIQTYINKGIKYGNPHEGLPSFYPYLISKIYLNIYYDVHSLHKRGGHC